MFTIITGAQFGDEGKGKIVDLLAKDYEIVARFQGGDNAGHTVTIGDDVYKLHQIPSGILVGSSVIIGPGVVLNPFSLMDEMKMLEEKGVKVTPDKFGIDAKASIIMPYHIALDTLSEVSRKDKIGTTKKGISHAYSDRVLRDEIRLEDLFDEEVFRAKIKDIWPSKAQAIAKLGGSPEYIMPEKTIVEMLELGQKLQDFAIDASQIINTGLRTGRTIMAEGAQGSLLDVVHGTQKYVTSSSTIAGSACTGLGVGPTCVSNIIGITKAYITRVGNGPLPTELTDEVGDHLVNVGQEFGTTTGRKRRCGWFDLPLVKKSIFLNGYTELAFTKLDVLTGLDPIQICVAYELDGERMDYPPLLTKDLDRCVPVYSEMSGWTKDLTDVKCFDDLPENAREYVTAIEKLCDIPITYVSVGPGREQTFKMPDREPEIYCNKFARGL
ncbi:Adenylosuccinate synthetase [Methanosarcinaceae archaeon Ag5]|uniref:Adenylosuccinate synthetase n=1 Tax=Methanolapillus africanus TaxID=3028297 RepID=A0AAE4SE45_9EURY|nr:Adenylosuccinate synthetase [Methanosarcinaceae archaeon Ag5]